MITSRDQSIINFLGDEGFHIATSNQIHKLFFKNTSVRYSRKRLEYLYNTLNVIKRTNSTIDNCFAYYTERKPLQTHHDLIRAELYTHIKMQYKVLEWHNEFTIVNIRPDAFCYMEYNGIVFPVFVEIHLNNKFNFEKYIDFFKNNDVKSMFGIMPRIIICTDREITIPITHTQIKFKIVDFKMKLLNAIFR